MQGWPHGDGSASVRHPNLDVLPSNRQVNPGSDDARDHEPETGNIGTSGPQAESPAPVDGSRPGFAVPSLQGRTVYLRALTPNDYPHLHFAETSTELAPRWRFRGSTPSPEQWAQASVQSVLAQFLVV